MHAGVRMGPSPVTPPFPPLANKQPLTTHTARLMGCHPVGPSACVGSEGAMDSKEWRATPLSLRLHVQGSRWWLALVVVGLWPVIWCAWKVVVILPTSTISDVASWLQAPRLGSPELPCNHLVDTAVHALTCRAWSGRGPTAC